MFVALLLQTKSVGRLSEDGFLLLGSRSMSGKEEKEGGNSRTGQNMPINALERIEARLGQKVENYSPRRTQTSRNAIRRHEMTSEAIRNIPGTRRTNTHR